MRCSFFLLLPFLAHAASQAQSTPRVVLVELFTSEGCSSCPPADRLLAQINNRRSASGQLIVGLSEHVTYWNRLGWTDPFSQDLFTQRQEAYGERFHLEGVYTPQMVVNGNVEASGGDGAAVERAVLKQDSASPITVRIDSAVVTGRTLSVGYEIAGSGPVPAGQIYAVVADDMASSQVNRGENSGHRLTHVSVARTLVAVGRISKSTARSPQLQNISLALPARIAGQPATGHHLVLFAQTNGTGEILAIDTRPF